MTYVRVILEKHKAWLRGKAGGKRADLRGVDLRGVDLRGANLHKADLRGANLYRADLRGTNLCEANLHRANLRGADLHRADLYGADLRGANLYGANLREANLYKTNLYGADLHRADLYGADLRGANLYGANLREANLYKTNLYGADLCGAKHIPQYICPLVCPSEGSFTGFKKANIYPINMEVIVKLRITETAKRSSATTRKCRCSEAEVISVESVNGKGTFQCARSKYNHDFIYKVGEVVKAEDFDEDRWNECSTGIHFFITREEAVNY